MADTPVDPAGTIRALHFAAGPRMSEYLTKCALGEGMIATSFSMLAARPPRHSGGSRHCFKPVVNSSPPRLRRGVRLLHDERHGRGVDHIAAGSPDG